MIQWEKSNLFFSIENTNERKTNVQGEVSEGVLVDDIDIEGSLGQLKSDQVISGMAALAELGSAIANSIICGIPKPESVAVDIGLDVSAGGKLIIVHGDLKAHMKLTIKWSSKS